MISHGRQLSRRTVNVLLCGCGVLVIAVLGYAKAPEFRYFAERHLHLTLLSLATAGLMLAGTRVQLGAAAVAWLRPAPWSSASGPHRQTAGCVSGSALEIARQSVECQQRPRRRVLERGTAADRAGERVEPPVTILY